jgi:uncharacterized YigZ family protein
MPLLELSVHIHNWQLQRYKDQEQTRECLLTACEYFRMSDQYLTIAEPCVGEFRDRGSKFLGYAFPVSGESDWQTHLEAVRKEHPKATHHCFAFRLGLDKNNYRANDDGEPSGTAGRPILGQIDSFGLTNVLIIVVRYFGGTLLGTSGLINAYRACAADALEKAEIIEKTVEDFFLITFDYAIMSNVMNAIKKLGLPMLEQDFGDLGKVKIAIPKSESADALFKLKAWVAGLRLEEALHLEKVEGMEIESIQADTP